MRTLPKLMAILGLLLSCAACSGGTSVSLPLFPDNSCNSCTPGFFAGGSDRRG
jgi:hypothetical protein